MPYTLLFICILYVILFDSRKKWTPLPGHAFRKYAFLPLSAYLNAIFSYGNLKSISYKKIHKNLAEAKFFKNYPTETGQKLGVIRANFCLRPNIYVFSFKKWTLDTFFDIFEFVNAKYFLSLILFKTFIRNFTY